MNTAEVSDAAVRERDAVLAYLEKTRDVWRDRSRKTSEPAAAMSRAKVAVLEGVIADIRDGVHMVTR